MIERCL